MAETGVGRRIQICAENRVARSRGMLGRLAQTGAIVETVTCLDECTRCRSQCFALVQGVMEYASSPEELGRKVLARFLAAG